MQTALVWNTFLGGSGGGVSYGIAVDGSGNVYVTGESWGTWGSPVRAYSGGPQDSFVARLDGSGVLTWNTFLGGSSADHGRSLAVDATGNVYVTGRSYATWGSPVRAFSGSYDAFAARLSGDGGLIWNTFLGGSGSDPGYGITVDGNGDVYVTGESDATWGSPERAHAGSGNLDAFAAKLKGDSGGLVWNTFLGGSGSDSGYAIAVDGGGNVYVAGESNATWGPPIRAFTEADAQFLGGYDAFAARLNGSGARTWNTFLGGSGNDFGLGIAVDGSGNVYVTGSSGVTWGSPIGAHTGRYDVLTAKLTPFSLVYADPNDTCGGNAPCVTTIREALAVSSSDASIYLYAGTYTESVSLSSSVTMTMVDDVTLTGTLTLSAGTFNTAGHTFTLQSDLTSSGGTLDANSGTIVLGGSAAQTVSGNLAFSNLTVDNTAGVAASGNLTVAGQLQIMAGTATLQGRVADVQIDSGATLAVASGSSLSVGGNWTDNGSFVHNDALVTFDKIGTATFSKAGASSAETFCNLTVSSSTVLDTGDDYLTIAEGCTATNYGVVVRPAPAQNAATNEPVAYLDGLGKTTAVLTSQGAIPLGSTALTVRAGQEPPLCDGNAFPTTAMKRWYDIQPTATSGVWATMRLYYLSTEASGVESARARIYHCGNSGGWAQLSGTQIRGTDANGNYVMIWGVSEFSRFAIGDVFATGEGWRLFLPSIFKQTSRLSFQPH